MPTYEQFAEYMRSALNHMFEPAKLGGNPLVGLCGEQTAGGAPLALRHHLIDAIKSLMPDEDLSHDSPRWRVYQVLSLRYIQQYTQPQVAEQMGLSVRQVRREQELALEALASLLWVQFRLDVNTELPSRDPEQVSAVVAQAPSLDAELAWLKQTDRGMTADLVEILDVALRTIQRLANVKDVRITSSISEAFPVLAVHPAALRQMLLNLFSAAMDYVPGGELTIAAESRGWDAVIRVEANNPRPGPRCHLDVGTGNLAIARRLAEMSGGALTLIASALPFQALLTLPVVERLPVLLIDDNADNLRLLKRYATGTRYQIIGAQHAAEAMVLIKTMAPRIIVLDVMMPDEDGWELLQRLKREPESRDIPVIMCTILSQHQLALSLGATDLISKPVGRDVFLQALDRQVASRASGSL